MVWRIKNILSYYEKKHILSERINVENFIFNTRNEQMNNKLEPWSLGYILQQQQTH